MDKKVDKNRLKIKTGIYFCGVFLILMVCFHFFNQFQEKEAKMNATYTAEATIRKVETQLGRYLENSELLKNIIASGCDISDEQFNELAGFMKKNKNVIEAYELAPDGIVQKVYPYSGNEEAIGLDMLKLPERKTEASLAKDSREYTIAGPYELKQGGTGALLFDPIYVERGQEEEFWGFSILVLNWEQFLKELQIQKLQDAGYSFEVWKKDADGNRITIMNDGAGKLKKALNVSCSVPNDTWYFEIEPADGWISNSLVLLECIVGIIISAFLTIGFWQIRMKKYREAEYAEKLEKSAKEAQEANEAKTRFLFNMSHDIRTPMNAIVGYSNLLEESLDNKVVARGYIEKIKASNSMLLSLINYILEMARIESGKIALKEEKGNLRKFVDMLKAVSEPQIEQKNLRFGWNLDIEHNDIICDTTKLREIVLNIVTNAIKYTPEGGKISLEIKELAQDRVGYANYSFVVEDTGIGMHEDYLPHIFEEFSREHTSTESKVSGVGLGLPIVKSLVELMNGNIQVESQLNKGTKFSILLAFPIVTESEDEVKEEKHKETTELTGKKILLVEDNELNAEIAEEILTRQGMRVDIAENGKKCLKILDEKEEGYYDVILMDVQMPVMNGYEATKAIRKSNKHYATIPIIAMTANAFEEDKEQALHAGMNAHVAKPLDIDNLLAILADIL